MTDAPPAESEEQPPPDPLAEAPGIDELIEWLHTRVPAVIRAKISELAVKRITEEIRDPALRLAWEQRNDRATMADLQAATGVSRGRIVWALGKHPRSDV